MTMILKDRTMTTFRYSLVSDLHIDHNQPKILYDKLEENIFVAGDTANGLSGLAFLQGLRDNGFNVFAVDGNHEHYSNVRRGRSIFDTVVRFRQDHPRRVDIDDTLTVLLVNGWYKVSDYQLWNNCMNDCRYCVGDDPIIGMHTVNLAAVNDANFLRYNLKEDRKFLVVTHTSPCEETLDPEFEGYPSNEFYWSPYLRELLPEFSDKIIRWHHGHTHQSNRAVVDGVLVLCNPRGYPRENPDWTPLSLSVDEVE